MKPYQHFQMITLLLLFSCSNGSSKSKNESNAAGIQTTGSRDKASFYCKLDGKEFSGEGTDQNINAAFHLTGSDKGQIALRLSNLDNPSDKLMFQVAAKESSTIFVTTATHSYIGYISQGTINYLDNPLTVTINSLNTTSVSGTFSGTYTLSEGSGDNNSKKSILVTDGKFTVPFSTSPEWKKLYNAE